MTMNNPTPDGGMTVKEAQAKRVCRICGEPIGGGPGYPAGWWEHFGEMVFPVAVVLNYGMEFAHKKCLETSQSPSTTPDGGGAGTKQWVIAEWTGVGVEKLIARISELERERDEARAEVEWLKAKVARLENPGPVCVERVPRKPFEFSEE